jgi:hypothetical protein
MVSTTAHGRTQDRLEKLFQKSTPTQLKAPVKKYPYRTFLYRCWQ